MKDIKASIVIPIYNAEKTIEKCLDSLISQTYSNIEIICVNDYSKDGVLSILERYEKNDPRIVLINHTENKNAGGARNTGIRAAQGEYICFVDQDDWLRQDAIEILVNASNDGELDCVTADWIDYYNEQKQIIRQNLTHTSDHNKNVEYALLNGVRILGCLFKREIFFENDLFFPENLFFEDNAIAYALILCCKKTASLSFPLYFYNDSNLYSTTHTMNFKKIQDHAIASDIYLDNFKKFGVCEQYRELIDFKFMMFRKIELYEIAKCPRTEIIVLESKIIKEIPSFLPNSYARQLPILKYLRLRYPMPFYLIKRMRYICKRKNK